MTVDKEEMVLPENTHLGMFEPSAIDGARAAKEVLANLNRGDYALDERLFKRDFLPILLGEVQLNDAGLETFSEAWKAVAGSLQHCLAITRNGVIVYSVPPIFSAYGAVINDLSNMGERGLRINLEAINVFLSRYNDRSKALAAYSDVVFSRVPGLKVNPEYLKMWDKVLQECGVKNKEGAVTIEASTSMEKISDMFEDGEDV